MDEDFLIETNLNLFKPIAYKVQLNNLIYSNGKQTGNFAKGKQVGKILSDKGLGDIVDHYFFLNENGKQILKNGGWLRFAEQPNEKFKILDNILYFIKEHSAIDYRTMLMMITDLNSPLKNVNNQEMLSGVKKLVKDGFVEEKTYRMDHVFDIAHSRAETLYSITYDGIIFLESGGYLERERSRSITTRHSVNNENEIHNKKKPKSLFESNIWQFTNHNIVAFFIILLIAFVLAYFGYKFIEH